jgi:peptidyl-prolyl cis-trans isomerase C
MPVCCRSTQRTTRGALLTAALVGGLTIVSVLGVSARAADRPVAKVEGILILESDLALAAEDLGGGPVEQNRDQLIGYLGDLVIGAKAATDAKIAESESFKRKLEHNRRKLLLEEYLTVEAKKAVTPEAVKKLYDDTVKSLPPEQEVRARHILLASEEEAKNVIARLGKGEDFAKLASELSKDPGSGQTGGDLGFFTKERMVPEFSEAAFRLDVGALSAPVKSQFGWHVIKVDEKRTKSLPPLDDVKDQIAQYLERKAQQDLVLGLRAKTKLERLDQPEKKDEPKKP